MSWRLPFLSTLALAFLFACTSPTPSAAPAPASHKAYVLLGTATGSIAIPFDVQSGDRGLPIALGPGANARSLAVSVRRHTAYVGTSLVAAPSNATLSGTVVAIDTTTNSPIVTVPILRASPPSAVTTAYAQGVIGLSISPDGSTLYALAVTEYDTTDGSQSWVSTITPINLNTNKALPALLVTGYASALAVASNDTAYVVLSASIYEKSVVAVNLKTGTISSPILKDTLADSIVISPYSKTAYVAASLSLTLVPIDLATNTTKAPLPLGVSSPFAPAVVSVALDGKAAYVSGTAFGTGSLIPIDLQSNLAQPAISFGMSSTPKAIAIAQGQTVYVADGGFFGSGGAIVQVDAKSGQVKASLHFTANESPFALALLS